MTLGRQLLCVILSPQLSVILVFFPSAQVLVRTVMSTADAATVCPSSSHQLCTLTTAAHCQLELKDLMIRRCIELRTWDITLLHWDGSSLVIKHCIALHQEGKVCLRRWDACTQCSHCDNPSNVFYLYPFRILTAQKRWKRMRGHDFWNDLPYMWSALPYLQNSLPWMWNLFNILIKRLPFS